MAGRNLIALDYGRRRVGVAGCQEDVPIAFGVTTLIVDGLEDLLRQLEPILVERKTQEVIIGLPITLANKRGTLSGEILRLTHLLEQRGWVVRLVDEALSSRKADALLRQRARRPKKQERDRTSAALVLQEYLDGHLPPWTDQQIAEIERLNPPP